MLRSLKGVAVAIIIGCGSLVVGSQPAVPTGTWSPSVSLTNPRPGARAVLLDDGRLLLTGGIAEGAPTSDVTIIDPLAASSDPVPTAPMRVPREGHAITALADGRVLVTGGRTTDGPTAAVEIFDAASATWTAAGDMHEPRAEHSATRLADGRVLVAGGITSGGISATLEIFDTPSATFSGPRALIAPRAGHAAAMLDDGRVLLAGGWTRVKADGVASTATSEFFDTASEAAVTGPELSAARAGATATRLLDGKVLIAGGVGSTGDARRDAETLDPTRNAFTSAGSMTAPRSGHLAFRLPHNNAVVLVGGDGAADSAEMFTPWREEFTAISAPSAPHANGTGTALDADGLLWVAGGGAQSELFAFATLRSDQDDYAPGDVVTISGAGWQPGETVTLTLQELPEMHTTRTLTAVADGAGVFVNTEFAPEHHHIGVRFYLTAVGAASEGRISFTDSPKVGTVVVGDQVPTPVLAGNDAVFEVTVTRGATGDFTGAMDVDLSVATELPNGVTAVFAENPLAFGPARLTKKTTLTLSTPGGLLSQTLAFRVRAERVGAPQDFATTAGANPRLVVQGRPRLEFLTPEFSRRAGRCSPAISVERQTGEGTPDPVDERLDVTLATTSTGGAFYGNAACTEPITTVAIHRNASVAPNIFYKDTVIGTPRITASGDGRRAARQDETITEASTTIVVSSSNNPSTFGKPVRFTATVTADVAEMGTPTGTVRFIVDGTLLEALALDEQGEARTAAVTTLTAGNHEVRANYTGSATFDNTSAFLDGGQEVKKATPTVTWAAPASITYGDSLGAAQLNATATIDGIFTYSPSAGAVLNAGTGQALSVTFTPADENYNSVTEHVMLDVAQAILRVRARNASRPYGDENPEFEVRYVGLVNGDTEVVVSGTPTFTTSATAESPVGIYVITPQGALTAANYQLRFVDGTLTITQASPVIAWSPPSRITYGTPLGAAHLTAVAMLNGRPVTGTFAYTPAADAVLQPGDHTLSVAFAPDDAVNLTGESATATITVENDAPVAHGSAVVLEEDSFLDLTLEASDQDGNPLTFTITAPAHGTLSGTGPGVRYTPAPHFSGMDDFTFSVSDGATTSNTATVVLTVKPKPLPTIATPVMSSLTPSTYGQNVTFRTTVSSAAGAPTGSVEFFDNGVSLGVTVLSPDGIAMRTTNQVQAGTRAITALYHPSGNFLPSSSAGAQVVNKAAVTSSFTVSPLTVQYSDRVTLTATITPAIAGVEPPAGRMLFRIGTQVIGSADLVLSGVVYKAVTTVPLLEDPAQPSGQLIAGTKLVTGSFENVSPNFAVANPMQKVLGISREDARVAWVGSKSLSTVGGKVTLQALVKDISATAEANGDVYPGDISRATVQFVNRATGATIATVPVTSGGLATFVWTPTLSSTSQTFTIGLVVSGYYIRNNTADNAILTITKAP